MLCHICGAELDENTKVCPQCSAEQEVPAEEPELMEQVDLFEEIDAASEEEAPTEEEAAADADDFDPRAFAGLDETMEFDPAALAAMQLEDEQPAQEDAAAEDAPKKAKKAKKEKKAKKRRPGAVAALVIAIVLVVLAAAAGALYYLTMPLEEAVLAEDFAAFQKLPEGETVTKLTIDRRETDRFQRSDAVWCDITTETDAVRRDRSYLLSYTLTTDGWQLFAVDNTQTDSWDAAPLAGVGLEELQALLVGQDVQADEEYIYTLTEEDVAEVEILSQTTDLNGRTDQVEATITVTEELISWTVNAQIGCVFAEQWVLDTFENAQATIDFKPGMDFKLTQEDHLEDLYATPITLGKVEEEDENMMEVIVESQKEEAPEETAEEEDEPITQTVAITEETISNFAVEDTLYRMEDSKQLVTCTFDLIKDVAHLQVEAEMIYGHTGKGWELEEVNYTTTVKKVLLTGAWVGTYTESAERKPSVTVTVETNEDGTEKATFAFTPSEATPVFGTGSYAVTSKVDPKTLNVVFTPGDWIVNPYFEMAVVGLDGVLLIDEGVITDNETFTITLQRAAATEA